MKRSREREEWGHILVMLSWLVNCIFFVFQFSWKKRGKGRTFNERHFVVGTCIFRSRRWLITNFLFWDLSLGREQKTPRGCQNGAWGDNKIKWWGRKIWSTEKMKAGSNNRRWKWRLYTLNQTREKKWEIGTSGVISHIFVRSQGEINRLLFLFHNCANLVWLVWLITASQLQPISHILASVWLVHRVCLSRTSQFSRFGFSISLFSISYPICSIFITKCQGYEYISRRLSPSFLFLFLCPFDIPLSRSVYCK